MLNDPPVDKLIQKIGNRYTLSIICAKRARQIIDQAQAQGVSTDGPNKQKPITIASQELMSGKITYTKS